MQQVIKKLIKQGYTLHQALEHIKKENDKEEKNLKMYKIMCRYR